MFKPGLICKKTVGSWQGYCLVVELRDEGREVKEGKDGKEMKEVERQKQEGKQRFAIIDNGIIRKRCNIMHLEPVTFVKVKKGESSERIGEILREAGYENKKVERKKWLKKEKVEKKK